jgi:hypothetical protein
VSARIEGLLLVALAVGSAAASGYVVGRHYPARRATDIPSRQETLDAMADELGLDAAQRTKVREISDLYLPRMQAVRQGVALVISGIRSETRARTREVMDADQRLRFDAYCARRDEQRRRADQ